MRKKNKKVNNFKKDNIYYDYKLQAWVNGSKRKNMPSYLIYKN